MLDVLKDTLIDVLRLIPFLFVAFLIIEYIEHKLSNKNKKAITSSGRFGPIIGSILGLFPQCGFGVAATNLYATRIISLGTLISIYLSTSDEMLPLLIANDVNSKIIIKVLLIKLMIGMLSGLIIDLILRKRNTNMEIKDFCEHDHCDCNHHGIVKSSIKHTLSTVLFLAIITLLLNTGIHYIGEEALSKFFLKDNFFSPFIACLFGLIPNCGASVLITELYLKEIVTFGTLIGGLLTGAGVSLIVLFKSNKNIKENITIMGIIYLIGCISGIIINLL